MRYYAFYLAKLFDERIDRSLLKSAMLKSALNPIFNVIAVSVAFVDTRLSIALYIILPRCSSFLASWKDTYTRESLDRLGCRTTMRLKQAFIG
jgi:hypothetical protein